MRTHASRRRGWRSLRLVGMLIAAMLCAACPEVSAQVRDDDAEMRRVFDQILQDPGNPALNLRYAQIAIERGESRKALAAYERILARDPANEDALAGIRRVRRQLDPALTRASVLLGGQFESNARRVNFQNSRTYDATLFGRADIRDERTIGDMRWRSSADVYGNYHPRFHDIDYGNVSASSGPVLSIAQDLRVHAFAGGGYAWLSRRTFFGEATAGANFEFDVFSPLREILVRWGYDFVGRAFSTRDATFVEVTPRFQFPNLLMEKAIGIVAPYWRYNGVFGSGPPGFDPRNQPFPARSHQLGLRADYFIPVLDWLTLDVNFGYEYRHFFESVTDNSKHRRDHLFVPGVQAIVTGLAQSRADLVLHYAYEHRITNDGPERYTNHIAGAKILWRF